MQVEDLLRRLDTDEDGYVTRSEFKALLRAEKHHHYRKAYEASVEHLHEHIGHEDAIAHALEKHDDGAAVNELFHMFAVTHEDFVHPMAVIELLWRSCCDSMVEKQQSSLATRLKVRQRTQMLVDHSLLLGSSSEGIYLHDIVLQYLRKRLSAEEMRVEQRKVVEGMVAASKARMAATGRGLQDTGSTPKAFAGEEVDW